MNLGDVTRYWDTQAATANPEVKYARLRHMLETFEDLVDGNVPDFYDWAATFEEGGAPPFKERFLHGVLPNPATHVIWTLLEAGESREAFDLDFSGCSGSALGCCCFVACLFVFCCCWRFLGSLCPGHMDCD